MTKKGLCLAVCLVLSLSLLGLGCQSLSKSDYEGAGVGAATGAVAGALIAGNPWEGGVIGGALGAIAGGAITHIARTASSQAATHNKPVSYQRGDEKVVSTPVSTKGKCTTVKESYFKDGKKYKEVEREVCN
ncbi:MAG: glycine zipper 2TM domain-containing protein [Desulfarculaceae bacterium]|nr:glycine zipper 2TM domain-containing protein [Desulfarculaceae bacterium]MCF8071950.1 glycine zipper 2TM domain-containing protein [Desulfarculaceae bacterium]MCF8101467.1 glycine zipper 2TM domain-containing protein [Desulfarculaceae bacterium]MCF8115017.1 glycine zipper 2TM domain-containing protein [Desulfarculaceae bacterium]